MRVSLFVVTLVLHPFSPRREVSYHSGNRALIANKCTSDPVYPAKFLLNPLVLMRQVSYTYGNGKRTYW